MRGYNRGPWLKKLFDKMILRLITKELVGTSRQSGGQCSRKWNAKSVSWRKSISRTRKECSSNTPCENLVGILETQGWMLTDRAFSAAYEPQI